MNSSLRLSVLTSVALGALAWTSAAQAVDTPPKPSPVGNPATAVPPYLAPATQSDNKWRFKYHDGRWWYWMTDETWVYHNNNQWVHYDPATYAAQTRVAQPANSGYANNSYANNNGSSNYGYRGSRGRGYYYGNEANRPVRVPFMGAPGFSPIPGGGGGFRMFVPMMN